MMITSLFGTRLLTGIGALAIAGTLVGGATVAEASRDKADRADKVEKRDGAHKAFRDEVRDATQADRDAIQKLRKQLATLYASDNPDTAEMKRLHAQIQSHKANIAQTRFDALLDAHGEMTPEQREKVARHMAKEGKKGKKGKKDKKAKKGKKDKQAKQAKQDKDDRRPEQARRGKAKGKDRVAPPPAAI